jgi:antitoxin MazE
MLRKVFKTGNSLVVSFPKDILEPIGITEGKEVSVELDQKNHQIIIHPVNDQKIDSIDEEFAKQVADFIEHYRPALEALARQ